MRKILIGSRAIKHHFDDFNRIPNDTDYAVDIESKSGIQKVEYLYNPVIHKYESNDIISPNNLLTLKMSHMFWDNRWEKHLYDICFLVKKGCKHNRELFYELLDFWYDLFGKPRKSDLTLNAEDFFDNAINHEIDHDALHVLLKNPPTYTKVLKDYSEVEPDETKWNKFSFNDKRALVEEEVMVMAYERFRKIKYRHAYTKMLKKFIINHAPLWEAEWILTNYLELEKPSFNYYKKIENA